MEIRLALQRHRAALGERGEPRRVSGERRWALMLAAGAVVVMFGVFALVVAADIRQQAANIPPSGVEYVEVGPGGQHIEGNVGYAQRPPAGGEHSPRWQNCGFYDEPVPNENAVHSLEHGAVWVTYSPHLPQDQVVRLRELASEQTYVLVSPYSDLPSPVVASAWGKQLRLGAAHDADLASFLRAYRQGPQTPEAGAPCTSGVGEPQR